ncbi:flagellar hook-basal body complex protein FliE [Litoreibacter sp.]|nr:flagellar hook-basal body complex protein FliE [Litoreibacter sp.]
MEITAQFAAQAYGAAKPATEPRDGSAFAAATQQFADVLKQGETAAMSAVTSGADPHALVEALAQSELAVQTAVAVRDKVVEAYQEILRMPV